jgi:cytochrome c553
MNRRILAATLTLIGATALSAYAFGGWAVITVDELPDHLTAGTPTQLSFMVRQHGVEPLTDLKPWIEAKSGGMVGGTSIRADAKPTGKRGQYIATVTVPKSGEWKLTINSGFGPSNLALLPMQAGDGKTAVAAISQSQRGKNLYVAKGCVTCHENSSVETAKGVASDVGPNLTEKKFDAAYLAMWLENPKIKPPTSPGKEMPNLGLTKTEIAAISMFINKGTASAAKQ